MELEELRGGADGERVDPLGPAPGPPPPPHPLVQPARATGAAHWTISAVCVLSAARVYWPAGPLWVFLHGLPCALSLVRKVGAGRWGCESIADARGIGDGSTSPPVPPSGNTLIPILTFPTALLNSVPSVCVVARKVSLITINQFRS